MRKTVVSLMCEKIKKQWADIDEALLQNPEKVIDYIHGEYKLAFAQINKLSQS
jgi:hypothetical protein